MIFLSHLCNTKVHHRLVLQWLVVHFGPFLVVLRHQLHAYIQALHIQMNHSVTHLLLSYSTQFICNLLNSSFLGCSVLMLTNLIDIFSTWACCSNKTSKQAWWCLYWLFSSKNRWRDQLMAGAIYWSTRSATPNIKWVISKNKIKSSGSMHQGDL